MRLLDKEYAYVKRYRELVDVMVKHGFGYLVDRYGLRPSHPLRGWLKSKPLKEQLILLSEAERLRLALEELGPTFIKFGQILSTRHDLVPEEFIRELSKLQDSVPSFRFSDVQKIIKTELGKKIDSVFISFNPEPLAAASIGQVHMAKLPGNVDVIVKVMRPGIEKIIETDLAILLSLARFAEKHMKDSKIFNPVGVIEEFSRIIRQEIDYTHEAQNADRFFLNFKDSETVSIPQIYWKYTTKRVLTMKYLEGIKISDMERIETAGLDRRTISNNFVNAYLKMIFEDNFYHADPHPGNIFVASGEKIIFLDFGMSGYIDPVLKENLINLIIAMQRNDIDTFIESLTEMGIVVDMETQENVLRYRLEEIINRYYSLDVKFIDPIMFLRDILDVVIKSNGKIPTNIMLLLKTLVTMDELSRELDPDHNVADFIEPYARKMFEERTSASYILKDTTKTIWNFVRMVKNLPRRVNHILTKAEKGTLKLELEHKGLDNLIEKLDIVSNRLSFSIIIASLIIGSSLIIQTGMSPSLLGVPLLGFFGFFIAGFLGMGLLYSIIRSGKW
ncbi:MAG: AarF/ABC1/UbiB kinase family protein [Candidatus Methanoperedens sp.]|nr:AarF/ABC1/UbiB kinase family protein [Candidatus Methanoperedens sp.]PKL53069.1 MAG: 2-octaprenyl-3-methyl-6-methoxy-1,4-benzoquinol hydroxylase [Candidatus Methanoperedenaceae archaeon HGW-Methanoperedenaceae-1]